MKKRQNPWKWPMRVFGNDPASSPLQEGHVTGNRIPSVEELMTHFALFDGLAMNAMEIAERVNCPSKNVLPVLLRLEVNGFIMREDGSSGKATEATKWKRVKQTTAVRR